MLYIKQPISRRVSERKKGTRMVRGFLTCICRKKLYLGRRGGFETILSFQVSGLPCLLLSKTVSLLCLNHHEWQVICPKLAVIM